MMGYVAGLFVFLSVGYLMSVGIIIFCINKTFDKIEKTFNELEEKLKQLK